MLRRPTAFVGLLLFTGASAASTGATAASTKPPRVLLIGIDGADLRIIDRLIAAGRLPTFSRLEREGAFGPLRSQEPLLSPIVWTTIATGRLPQDHGILDFVEVDPQGNPGPITSSRRRVPALWNILGEFGKSSGFVGWYASYPAERVTGFVVSDRLGFHQVSSARAVAGATFPEDLARDLEARFGAPRADVEATRRRFTAGTGPLPPGDAAARLDQLARIYATSEFYRRALPYLQGRFGTDLLAVYFEGIDACGHLFMEDAPPKRPEVSDEAYRAFSSTVDRYYEYQDEVLADLLRLEGPETVTVVVSDHGFKWGEFRPRTSGRADTGIAPLWHRMDGVLFLHGSPVRRGARVQGAGILDVAPTVLARVGVPLSRELPGRVLAEAFRDPSGGGAPVASYRASPPRAAPAAPPDSEAVQKLRALGYLSGGSGAIPHDREGRTASSFINEGQVRTHAGDWRGALRAYGRAAELDPKSVNALAPAAAIYLGRGETARAGELLDRASKIDPNNLWVLVQKASLALTLGRPDDAEKALAAARRLDDRLPGVAFLAARIARARGETPRALEEIERAEQLADSDAMRADILLFRAEVESALGRFSDAQRSLERAAPVSSPGRIAAARGALAFARHDAAGAEASFRQALAAEPGSSSIERQLGEALGAAGRWPEAEAALRRSIANARSIEEKESGWGDLSVVFQKSSRDKQALSSLKEAVAAVPESSALWAMLGAALGRQGDLEAAIRAYERSVSIRPTALACKTLAALVYEVRKDPRRAADLWKQSLELDPNQPEVREFLRRYGAVEPRRKGG